MSKSDPMPELCGPSGERATAAVIAQIDTRPHSRACGIVVHPHGARCHRNCPSCGGMVEPTPAAEAPTEIAQPPSSPTRPLCVCGHHEQHHRGGYDKIRGDYCNWRECGCPWFVAS